MGRVLRLSLIAIALGCVVGCGGAASSSGSSSTSSGGGNGGGGGTTTMLSTLSGQYAFMLTGYDSSGNPMAVAGSMTADGKGNVTAGSADVTDNFVLSSTTSLAGTYTLDSSLRGVITLTDTFGSLTHPLVFAFTMKSNGTFGEIMGLDTNPFTIGGTIQQQTSSAFSLSSIAGSYVFELDSNTPNETKRQGTIGRFTLASNGTTTSGLLDTSAVGTGVTSSSAAVTVTFNGAGPSASSGRGTLTITQNSATTNYVYYIVFVGKIIIIENDTTGSSSTIRAGTAIGQTIPSTANTSGSVFALGGIDAAISPSNNISAVGVLQVTNLSASLTWDSNDAGTLHGGTGGPITASNQTVAYDSTTGRGTITVTSGFSNGLFNSAVFYLAGSGQGFILDTTAGANNRALDGSLQAQTGAGSFSAGSLPGPMIVRAVGNSVHNIGTVVGTITSSSNTFVFTFDSRSLGITDALNLVSSGDTISGINVNTGRGTLTIVPTNGFANSTTEIFYIVGQNQLAFVDVTPSPANAPAPVFFFDPE